MRMLNEAPQFFGASEIAANESALDRRRERRSAE
jgi:hypothetical protein